MRKLFRDLCVVFCTLALLLGSFALTDWSNTRATPEGSPWHNGNGKKLGHIETVSNNKFCPGVEGCNFWAADPFRCFYYCTAADGSFYNLTLAKRDYRGGSRAGSKSDR